MHDAEMCIQPKDVPFFCDQFVVALSIFKGCRPVPPTPHSPSDHFFGLGLPRPELMGWR